MSDNNIQMVNCDRCGHVDKGRFDLSLCTHCITVGGEVTRNDVIYGPKRAA